MDNMRYVAASLLTACAMLAGCSDAGNTMGHAEQIGAGYYQALKDKDFHKAASFFLNRADAPQQQWLVQIQEYNRKLGDLQSYKLVDEAVNTVYSGTRYILRYSTHYSKFPAMETLVLFEGVVNVGPGQAEGLGVENLFIQSKGL